MAWLKDAADAAAILDSYHAASVSGDAPVLRQPPIGPLLRRLDARRLLSEGGLSGDRLAAFLEEALNASTRLHHPGYMAHQAASPTANGAIASLIDGAINNPMNIYEMGAFAAALEHVCVNWMLEKAGWRPAADGKDAGPPPPSDGEPIGGGLLTHGGSLANLTALAAARARIAPEAWVEGCPDDLVILAADESHYSVSRAAGLLGLGARRVRALPASADGRADPERLPQSVARIRDSGERVMALISNACSTAAGLYDPVAEISSFCREAGIWHHVDGAHGASALLSPKYRGCLNGLRQADSLTWDAHKMLRVPGVCAAALFRDRADIDRAFIQQGSYLFHEKDEPGVDFISRTVECTKSALGLKLFMTIAEQGEGALGAYIESRIDLARAAAEMIAASPDFEIAVAPESNIVCFRMKDADDAQQLRIRRALLEGGRFFPSSTEFMGRRWLRLALMSETTRLDHIAALLDEIRAIRSDF
ncbi:MAG: aspartate aminotransferase family protein [Parvularculaceae bacterium]